MTTHSRLIKFDRDFQCIDLAEYFQLRQGPYESLSIDKTVESKSIGLTIRYTKYYPCPVLPLLPELIRLIEEYLSYTLEIETKIEYSQNYPFAPPMWFIEGVTHTIPRQGYGPFYLLDYYIDKINQHNHLYNLALLNGTQWNPAISVEQDILIFLQRILHFDELFKI